MIENLETKLSKIVDEKSIIPKPETDKIFRVLRFGKRRNEKALIYSRPNNKDTSKHYEKGVTITEFQIAHNELIKNGCITRSWFKKNLINCAEEGGCNFTTIGGIFELLREAKYSAKGIYISERKDE